MIFKRGKGKKRVYHKGAGIALAVAISLSAAFLTGCGYSSFDEYLEILGIKDPGYDDATEDATTYVVTGEDVVLSSSTEASQEGLEAIVQAAPDDKESGFDSTIGSFYKKITGTEDDGEATYTREELGLTDEGIKKLKAEQSGKFAYDRLTEIGKTLYVEILAILQHQAKNVSISLVSDDAINVVFDYVLNDHPELFWVDGYKCTNHTVAGNLTKITFTGDYIYDEEGVKERQAKINEYVNECLANAPSSDDDYYVIKYIYEYIVEHTEYQQNDPDDQNICSVFIDGKSVCNGYAKATQYLLNKLGIECIFVTGTVATGDGTSARHAWNLVRSNDKYYYVDTTWGDASYHSAYGSSADMEKVPSVNYDYLCVTTKDLEETHTISDILRMPECNSMDDNYYIREDEYFKTDDMTLVKDLFDRRTKDGSNNVTIKCATQEVYDSLVDKLITQNGVFDFLGDETGVVSYTVFRESRKIIFWIDL